MTAPASGDRTPTIYDVAERAGVSKSLVSLVLRGGGGVSAARRAAVDTAIRELGYRPSRAATELASRRSNGVEVVIDDYRNLSFVDLLSGIGGELSGGGYHLTVAETRLNARLGTRRHGSQLAGNLAGLIIAAEPDDDLLEGWTGPTVVAGWRSTVPAGADLVATDDEFGGRLAADHLLGLGHRHLGHLTGAGGPAAHRRTAFTAQVAAAGLTPRTTGTQGTSEEDGYQAAARLLDEFPYTTAIFAANDTMALGALAAIRTCGRTVPGEISVLGYDNTPLAKSRYLAISSIDDRSDVVGAAVGRALLDRFDDPAIAPRRTLVQPTLVVRETTGPPPRGR